MAYLDQEFNINELPQGNGNFDPLPPGWYNADITKAELMPTKAGNGKYIKLRYDITGPTHQGRVVFSNLNIKNPNPKAEEIGRQQLGDILRAIGVAKITDSDQLVGGSLQIKLDIRPASDQFGASNEVRGYKSMSGFVPSANPPSAPAASSPAPAKASPPWAAKK